MEIAKITSKGQVTIPKAVRDDLGLESGDKVLWIKSGKRWEILNPTPTSTITAEERATSDRLKERFVAEAAAKYDLDVNEIKRLSQTKTPEELLADIQQAFAGVAEEEGWETEEDIADFVFKERYERRS
ncbi:MAG: AbrB/MazE/SpoVT family DNA-binding domain-containing protein [Thermomicrobiales bacterium]|nr:AbrB/MazE/SpoVT family DNA-binding domain-containing protein [Thermomicrobiales bacterium]